MGLARYFTGKPCKHGHVAERNLYNSVCIECYRAFQVKLRSTPEYKDYMQKANRRSYEKNREKVLERTKKRREAGYNKRYYEDNKEKFLASVKNWIKRNPERRNVYRQNRRAGTKGGTKPSDINRMLIEQSCRCTICKVDFSDTGYHIDHIIPVTRGGMNDPSNLQLLCPTCNRKKGNKTMDEFLGKAP